MISQIKLLFISGLILIFMLAAQTMVLAGGSTPVIFSDVTKGEPNRLFINYLTHRGLIKGYADGKFRPGANLTRAEAVSLLTRAAGISSKTAKSPFKDVKNNHWAANNIIAALEAGLIKGYPDGTFRPNALLTRAEGIALLLRISKQPGVKIPLPVLQDLSFKHWAAGPIAVGLAAEFVSLSTDKQYFLPNIPMTRREMARALAVLLSKDPELAQAPLNNQANVLQGTVEITRAGTSFAATGQFKVLAGDTIKTAANSTVEVIFTDGTGLQVKENTELTIKEMKGRTYIKADGTNGTAVEWLALELKQGKIFGALATPEATTPTDTAAFLKGQMVTILKSITAVENKPGLFTALASKPASPWWKYNRTKRVKVKVDMPWGVAAIRGTFWENVVSSDGRSKTTLLTGDGELTSGGQTVVLKANEKTEIISPNAAPIPPTPMTSEDKKEWVEAKAWVVERAQDIQVNQEKALPPAPPASTEPVVSITPQTPPEEVKAPAPTLPALVDQAIREAEQSTLTLPTTTGGGSSVAVVEVNLDKSSVSIAKAGGVAVDLNETVVPANATNKAVTWSSSNTSIVTVNESGVLTPVSVGTATITVTTVDKGKTAACTVNVSPLAMQPAVNYTVGDGPISAVLGNFNGDAYDDIVVTNSLSNNGTILFGNDSNFAYPSSAVLETGTSPRKMVQENFDYAGSEDLAMVRAVVNDVYVMLRDGDVGSFYSSRSYPLGSTPKSLNTGKFNDDTLSDLVAGLNDNVYVLLNTGGGNFDEVHTHPVGTGLVRVALGNFDSDPGAYDDLAVARSVSNDVYILKGIGNGEFQGGQVIPLGFAPTSITVGLFNNDGNYDLAVTRAEVNDIYILLGNGDGTFTSGGSYPVGSTPGGIAIGDFNRDYIKDLIVTSNDGTVDTVSVLLGNGTMGSGTGTFQAPVSFQVGTNPINIIVRSAVNQQVDMVVVTNKDSDNISVLLNDTPSVI